MNLDKFNDFFAIYFSKFISREACRQAYEEGYNVRVKDPFSNMDDPYRLDYDLSQFWMAGWTAADEEYGPKSDYD